MEVVGGIRSDHFSARYTACINLEQNETLKFILGSDDGSRLIVDQKNTVIENWKIQGFALNTAQIALNPGEHKIEVEYFKSGGASRIKFDILNLDSTQTKLYQCKK